MAYVDVPLSGGGTERVALSDTLRMNLKLDFNERTIASESDLWTFNRMAITGPVFFYENLSDTSKAYLCLRDTDYTGTWSSYGVIKGAAIKLKELI